ncbi:hypothetical protein JRQ81_014471 [Phrynocephalus forsythii]|uniref:ZSWIM3 N-terminal domain-containing protein n=1 Tax=Phrynocephalus forsythii TaxID=171643 RepID=A0A9Q0XXQ5_9SAUR|nr:hypothetical protein JRQ81_014471 [Phrynocephalus forsythii]
MERGSCFKNYEDFRESFSAYKKENRLRYRLQSGLSVRFYNRKHGASVREDVTFMQARFGCVRLREYCKKKPRSNLCPAYLVLEYNKDLDRLVVCEVNSHHVHAESKPSSVSYRPPPLPRVAAPVACSKDRDTPPLKLRKEEPAKEQSFGMGHLYANTEVGSKTSVKAETDSEEPFLRPPSPEKEPEVPRAEKDKPQQQQQAATTTTLLLWSKWPK